MCCLAGVIVSDLTALYLTASAINVSLNVACERETASGEYLKMRQIQEVSKFQHMILANANLCAVFRISLSLLFSDYSSNSE